MDANQLTDHAERGIAEAVLPPYTPPSQPNNDSLLKTSTLPASPDKNGKAEVETIEKVEKRENAKKDSAAKGKQKPARKKASFGVRFRLWYNTYRFAPFL